LCSCASGLVLAEKSEGLTVTGVLPAGAASRDGRFKGGDLVTHIDGHSVQHIRDAKPLMLGDVGTYVEVSIVRGDRPMLLRVLRPDDEPGDDSAPTSSARSARPLTPPMDLETPTPSSQHLSPFTPGKEDLSNSEILVELRSTRLQVRRLQKDVHVLRTELNEAEVDRDSLSFGLRAVEFHQERAHELISLYAACTAFRNNASVQRRIHAADFGQKILTVAASLAHKAAARRTCAVLTEWRMEAMLNAQQSACEELIAAERVQLNNVWSLNNLRRNMVRRLCSVVRGWYDTAHEQKCFRIMCSRSVPADAVRELKVLQFKLVVRECTGDVSEVAWKAQLCHSMASAILHLHASSNIAGKVAVDHGMLARLRRQIGLGRVQLLSGAAAEVYVSKWQHEELENRKRVLGHGKDFYEESLRTKKLEEILRKRNQKAVEAGKSNSEGVAIVHVTYQAFSDLDVPASKMVSYLNTHIDKMSSLAAKTNLATKSRRQLARAEGPVLELSSRTDMTTMIIGQMPAPEAERLALARTVPRWHYHLQARCFRDWVSGCRAEQWEREQAWSMLHHALLVWQAEGKKSKSFGLLQQVATLTHAGSELLEGYEV